MCVFFHKEKEEEENTNQHRKNNFVCMPTVCNEILIYKHKVANVIFFLVAVLFVPLSVVGSFEIYKFELYNFSLLCRCY